jgi:hypothetical protein
MKHSIDELVALARHYYPQWSWGEEPNDTEHRERRLAAADRAIAKYDDWRAMHRRINAQLPGCAAVNFSTYLQARTGCDGPFWGLLELPILPPEIGTDELTFYVSTLAPYYVIYRKLYYYIPGTAPKPSEGDPDDGRWKGNARKLHAFNFELTPEEEPYARVLAAEIERTFGYEALPPDIGKEVVPDLSPGNSLPGESTIYNCLFMGPL